MAQFQKRGVKIARLAKTKQAWQAVIPKVLLHVGLAALPALWALHETYRDARFGTGLRVVRAASAE